LRIGEIFANPIRFLDYMKRVLIISFTLISLQSWAQNILPDFSATTRGKGKVIIGWTNAYSVVTQISIQRSYDSLRNYKTLLTVPDPHVLQNGFVDSKAPTDYQFYRLFIVLDSGKYLFTKPKRAVWDTTHVVENLPPPKKEENNRIVTEPPKTDTVLVKEPPKEPPPPKTYYVKRRDSIIMEFKETYLKLFRDSILSKTKDTLVFRTGDTLLIRPFVPKEVYKPSLFVFTGKDGNVTISLPNVNEKKYHLKFFEEDQTPLFELKEIKESPLTLDKTNFVHGGWFRFELYENGQLKEKHKFFISKDF
jgi:hypothetical protein